MRKYLILTVVALMSLSFTAPSFAAKNMFNKNAFTKSLSQTFKSRGQDVIVDVEVLKEMDEPAGYFFLKVIFKDPKTQQAVGEQFMFSNGEYLAQDFLDVKTMSSLGKSLAFDYAPSAKVDVSNLTLAMGKKGAKNVIVEVTDFQCPYCVEANAYLHEKLKGKNNVALYIMHLPLRQIHPRAEILAKVFEAGILMGENFNNDLYDKANGNLTEEQIIDKYANKTKNASKFKAYIKSQVVIDKVKQAEAQAIGLGIKATPAMFINGKPITGFDKDLIDKAISSFK